MAKFDVFVISGQRLAVVIQSDILPSIETTLVIPLIAEGNAAKRSTKLNPTFELNGGHYVLMPTLIAALPNSSLRRKVGSLKSEQDTIADAIDMVLYGF